MEIRFRDFFVHNIFLILFLIFMITEHLLFNSLYTYDFRLHFIIFKQLCYLCMFVTLVKNEVFLQLGSVRSYDTVRSFSLILVC